MQWGFSKLSMQNFNHSAHTSQVHIAPDAVAFDACSIGASTVEELAGIAPSIHEHTQQTLCIGGSTKSSSSSTGIYQTSNSLCIVFMSRLRYSNGQHLSSEGVFGSQRHSLMIVVNGIMQPPLRNTQARFHARSHTSRQLLWENSLEQEEPCHALRTM